MPDEHPSGVRPIRHEAWLSAALVVLAVILRSLVFVFWEQSYYDSDQAIIGLMAKHLIEGRAFPVFYYGQNYMLGVEAYLAAPVFLLAGVSVTTLKLPLLGINIAVALLLLRTFVRDVGLRPLVAMVPVMFFAIPNPGVAAEILAPNGGNVAPFLYLALLWVARKRPVLSGLLFGIGFLQREFTLYAVLALLIVEAINGELWTRAGIRRRLGMARTALEVWLVVHILKGQSSAAGPGSSMADLMRQGESIVEFTSRFCTDPAMIPRGLTALVFDHFPILFGTQPRLLSDLGVQSTVSQGFSGAWIILLVTAAVAVCGVAWRLLRERAWRPEYNPCAYLVLTALLSQAGYIVGRCGGLHLNTLRYELLSIVGLAGLGAWFLCAVPSVRWRQAWLALACALVLVTTIPSARLLGEYLWHEPENPKRMMARHLETRGIKYAYGDYWRAYAITFLTNERVIVAGDDFSRIRDYARQVEANKEQAVRIAREFCPGGSRAMEGLWICPY